MPTALPSYTTKKKKDRARTATPQSRVLCFGMYKTGATLKRLIIMARFLSCTRTRAVRPRFARHRPPSRFSHPAGKSVLETQTALWYCCIFAVRTIFAFQLCLSPANSQVVVVFVHNLRTAISIPTQLNNKRWGEAEHLCLAFAVGDCRQFSRRCCLMVQQGDAPVRHGMYITLNV